MNTPLASAAKRCVKWVVTKGSVSAGASCPWHNGQSGHASEAPVAVTVAPSKINTYTAIAAPTAKEINRFRM